jgi:hypothetical protein
LAKFNIDGCIDWLHMFSTNTDDGGMCAKFDQIIKFDNNNNLYFLDKD